jgi:sigma-70-like protein
MSRRSTSPHDAEYDEFVAASWRRLCWTAYMLTGDRQLAEDLAQTALVKTYVAWPRVRRDDAFAYARRVLVNANIDRLRRRHLTEAFTGPLAPLGWHSMSWLSDGLVPSTVARPAFMHAPPPEHTDVYQDSGPMRVGCRPVSDARCGLFYVLGNRDIGWFTGYRLGDADFLRTGRPMELIPGGTLENNRFQPTVVGGMHGTTTTQVVLTLKDGTTANATVDSGKISTGDTIFWAVVDSPPVRATASDGAGRVVEDHELTPCDDPVDCSTR